jgi:hypothetical protein
LFEAQDCIGDSLKLVMIFGSAGVPALPKLLIALYVSYLKRLRISGANSHKALII